MKTSRMEGHVRHTPVKHGGRNQGESLKEKGRVRTRLYIDFVAVQLAKATPVFSHPNTRAFHRISRSGPHTVIDGEDFPGGELDIRTDWELRVSYAQLLRPLEADPLRKVRVVRAVQPQSRFLASHRGRGMDANHSTHEMHRGSTAFSSHTLWLLWSTSPPMMYTLLSSSVSSTLGESACVRKFNIN